MDYMFKDVSFLTSVTLISKNNKSVNILSLMSTFENCKNLKTLNINGFNTNKTLSMKKLFYGSGLT